MAVRQYIGARYVPLYAGDWDSTKNYEPLTIVTDANGNSFTSLKDVPAGTALTDRSYWIQTSSFSGAVDVLTRRMSAAEDNIVTLEGDVQRLQQDIDNISMIPSKLLADRHFLIVTDSYGHTMGNVTTPFTTPLKSMLLAAGAAGAESVYIRGGSFTRSSSLYEAALLSYAGDKNVITDVVVVGGYNDAVSVSGTTDTDLTVGIANFVASARTNFPNALLYFAFAGRAARPRQTSERISILTVRTQIQNAWESHGAVYLNGVEFALLNSAYMQDDGIHPNDAGNSALANAVFDAIMTGSTDITHYAPLSISPAAGITVSLLTGYEVIQNDTYTLIISTLTVDREDGTYSQSQPLDVGTVQGALTRDLSRVGGVGIASQNSIVQAAGGTNTRYVLSNATIIDGVLRLRPLLTAPLYEVARVTAEGVVITMPSLMIG